MNNSFFMSNAEHGNTLNRTIWHISNRDENMNLTTDFNSLSPFYKIGKPALRSRNIILIGITSQTNHNSLIMQPRKDKNSWGTFFKSIGK